MVFIAIIPYDVFQNTSYDPAEVEKIRAEVEARSRLELNKKLEEVNTYLEEQARARDRIDRMRDQNEQELRQTFDRTRKDLMVSNC